MAKTAVVLFNLGGPDGPDAVAPFLFNLFNDRAIITLPQPLRWFLARLISGCRATVAREIYAKIGGGSPLLANTEAQARALDAALGPDYRCFIAMRYWHPFSRETVREVAAWQPTASSSCRSIRNIRRRRRRHRCATGIAHRARSGSRRRPLPCAATRASRASSRPRRR